MLFQSTLRRTERQNLMNQGRRVYNFNPRSDERSDWSPGSDDGRPESISIHAPTNGATIPPLVATRNPGKFQSTLRRTERQLAAGAWWIARQISIHAPTNGATADQKGKNMAIIISIHAPTNGATNPSSSAFIHK